MLRLATSEIAMMNNEQLNAFNTIIDSVIHTKGNLFFLNGPAGTGKTFCYNTICHKLRSENRIVLCVASSGIASLLQYGAKELQQVEKSISQLL